MITNYERASNVGERGKAKLTKRFPKQLWWLLFPSLPCEVERKWAPYIVRRV